jgi:hypothetical protein
MPVDGVTIDNDVAVLLDESSLILRRCGEFDAVAVIIEDAKKAMNAGVALDVVLQRRAGHATPHSFVAIDHPEHDGLIDIEGALIVISLELHAAVLLPSPVAESIGK